MVATKLFFLLAFLDRLFWRVAGTSASYFPCGFMVGLPGIAGKVSSALAGGVSSGADPSIPDGGRKFVNDWQI
jgi:hypothetical protein